MRRRACEEEGIWGGGGGESLISSPLHSASNGNCGGLGMRLGKALV